ncbi:hypothetical protein [Micromonospora sp. NPDC047074]|uniref:hypothetical protein n=1 Tax=Micromonospora sp. NPDC047074 TaxID=3154339 RepID=UPI00340A7E93
MSTTQRTATAQGDAAPPSWVTIPWPGAAVALGAVAAMVTTSIVAWPEMSAEIVTRAADGRHGESVSNRAVTAVALPLALLGLTALLSVVLRLDHELLHRTSLGRDRDPERARRVLSWTLSGVSVVLLVLHVGLVSLHTGDEFPLEQAVAGAVGVLLACLGAALPLAAPGGRFDGRLEHFRAALGPAYRLAAFVLVVGGVATIAAATISAGAALVAAASAVAGAFLVVIGVALHRRSNTGGRR